jgi:hypothetical protein
MVWVMILKLHSVGAKYVAWEYRLRLKSCSSTIQYITQKILSRQNISSILLEHRRLAATTNELKIKSGGHQISRPT